MANQFESVRELYSPSQILHSLNGKWLLMLGDSCTRGMMISLLNQLDENHQNPFSKKTWYNSTLGNEFDGGNEDFQDFSFIQNPLNLKWYVDRKSISQPLMKRYQVRITYQNVKYERDFAPKALKSFFQRLGNFSIPDVVYMNAGAWGRSSNDSFENVKKSFILYENISQLI